MFFHPVSLLATVQLNQLPPPLELQMKQLLITIAAVLLVGCGPSVDIWEAAKEGNIEAVKQHLAAGTVVNAIDDDWTPLKYAAHEGHKEIVELLITKDADVNAKNEDGETPLDWAINFKQTEVADLLRKHGGKTGDWFKAGESIHIAASEGHIEAFKQHLAAGTDVNAKYRDGVTPLHLAALEGHKEIAELLIAADADVNAKENRGGTPLHFAASQGWKESAELLITAGAEVNAKDNRGRTPLDSAILFKETEPAALLRKYGGKIAEELKAKGK